MVRIEKHNPQHFFMTEQLLSSAIKVLESCSEPLLFDELVEKIEAPSDLHKELYSQLKESPDIFFHEYQVDDKTVSLFWRADLRRKSAEEAFVSWMKQSALVYLFIFNISPFPHYL